VLESKKLMGVERKIITYNVISLQLSTCLPVAVHLFIYGERNAEKYYTYHMPTIL